MSEIIIYGSKYGTTKKYAEELSKRTNIDVVSYDNVENLDNYNTIIYLGPIYAGGVLGMAKTFNKISNCENKIIIIATVGVVDPIDIEYANAINNNLKRQLSNDIYENAHIYHLRGGIDYSKLNFIHKMMMTLFYKKAKKLPEEKKTVEVKTMIETYNSVVDFINFDELDKIIAELDKSKINSKSK